MSRNQTADEVKDRHIEMMGNQLGTIYHALWNELAWLYMKWQEYVELYGTKPSRIELINQASSRFFRVVQDTLWDDTILHVARLTDTPKSAGKENLSIRRLPVLIQEDPVRDNVEQLINLACDKAEFCRDWRNRHIAHKDLALAMKTGARPLQTANHAKIKDVLLAISDVLNAVSEHYMDSTTMFKHVDHGNSAVSLLYVIDDGLRFENERRERFERGEYRKEDIDTREL
jgi:hypothetical protein